MSDSTAIADPGPLYRKVKDHILARIKAGEWAPGTRVPSENEIVESFQVSRMTANRALNELTQEGWLARVAGVGTFVRQPPQRASLIEVRDIAEEIRERGHIHSARIEVCERDIAGPATAGEFELPGDPPLFHVVMVHTENGVPIQIEDRWVNPAVAPDFLDQDFTRTTPASYLIGNIPVDEVEHTVEAVMPSPRQQHLLDIPANEPCLALARRTWATGQVVTVARFIYPASRFALHTRLKRQ
jgi:GntR family histidine utilization transcriptional repressor